MDPTELPPEPVADAPDARADAETNAETNAPADAKTGSPAPHTAPRRSTRDYTVDVYRAEAVADLYDDFDTVMVREIFEGQPVKKAIRLILWARQKAPANPYRKLRDWARRNGTGFYCGEILRRDAGEVYREFLAYAETKRARLEERTGRARLTQDEIEELARTFYAPRTRADMASISEATWASYHEELAAEAEDAA